MLLRNCWSETVSERVRVGSKGVMKKRLSRLIQGARGCFLIFADLVCIRASQAEDGGYGGEWRDRKAKEMRDERGITCLFLQRSISMRQLTFQSRPIGLVGPSRPGPPT